MWREEKKGSKAKSVVSVERTWALCKRSRDVLMRNNLVQSEALVTWKLKRIKMGMMRQKSTWRVWKMICVILVTHAYDMMTTMEAEEMKVKILVIKAGVCVNWVAGGYHLVQLMLSPHSSHCKTCELPKNWWIVIFSIHFRWEFVIWCDDFSFSFVNSLLSFLQSV